MWGVNRELNGNGTPTMPHQQPACSQASQASQTTDSIINISSALAVAWADLPYPCPNPNHPSFTLTLLPGLTTDFIINTSSPLAIRYNDRSPLENHHLAVSVFIRALGEKGRRPCRGGEQLLHTLREEEEATQAVSSTTHIEEGEG